MSDIQTIKNRGELYEAAKQETAGRLRLWQNETKATILKSLEQAASVLKNFDVGTNQAIENHESVFLKESSQPSTFSSVTKTGMKGLARVGGSLIYAQGCNGNIWVFLEYPFIEDLEDKRAIEMLYSNMDPKKFNEKTVLTHVADFLEKLRALEPEVPTKSAIGFRRPE